ncbi:hypothetical protein EHM92_04455 [bacterium]|nr:MAG: hypothetical protein EHM92_04455 [bacterium]
MENQEFFVLGQLFRQKGNVEVQQNTMEQRQGPFYAQQERKIVNLSSEKHVEQKQVDYDEKYPEGEKLV